MTDKDTEYDIEFWKSKVAQGPLDFQSYENKPGDKDMTESDTELLQGIITWYAPVSEGVDRVRISLRREKMTRGEWERVKQTVDELFGELPNGGTNNGMS